MPQRGDSRLDCREARERTRAFLGRDGALGERAEWRAHLAGCKECDTHYRETVEMLSRLHRARRDGIAERNAPAASAPQPERPARVEESEPELPQRSSLIAFSLRPARATGWRQPKRALWLGWSVPILALVIVAAIGFSGSDPRRTTAQALAGEVEAGGHLLAPGGEPRELEKGAKIVAAAQARVRVADAATELTLEGEGALALEALAPLRVRVFGGRVQAQGPCTLSTALGVVSSPAGALVLELGENGLSARATLAGASFQDGHGRRELEPGRELVVQAPLAPPAVH